MTAFGLTRFVHGPIVSEGTKTMSDMITIASVLPCFINIDHLPSSRDPF